MRHRTINLFATLALTSLLACVPMDGGGNGGGNGGGDGGGNGGGNGPQTRTFNATLSGDQEVPPVQTEGTGTGTFTLDTSSNEMSFTVEFSGLSGPVTVAHFHAAPAGQSGGVIIDLTGSFAGMNSGTVQGTATFNASQLADLDAGNVYINLHTEANGAGEIRGQLIESQ